MRSLQDHRTGIDLSTLVPFVNLVPKPAKSPSVPKARIHAARWGHARRLPTEHPRWRSGPADYRRRNRWETRHGGNSQRPGTALTLVRPDKWKLPDFQFWLACVSVPRGNKGKPYHVRRLRLGRRMRYDLVRHVGRSTEMAMPKSNDEMFVTIRCRKCGHIGNIRRWQAENKRMKCSKCGWTGATPKRK